MTGNLSPLSAISPNHFSLDPHATSERSNAGLPPSLWMSPTSTAPSTPGAERYNPFTHHAPSLPHIGIPSHAAPHGLASNTADFDSPISPHSAIADGTLGRTGSTLSDILSDSLFSRGTDPSSFSSPLLSESPDGLLATNDASQLDPEMLAKEDPLATQVWKMYARTKANLPHAQRMENLTWRMMALALKKKKEDEARQASSSARSPPSSHLSSAINSTTTGKSAVGGDHPSDNAEESSGRGRRIDKGKVKVSIVGFDGTNQDGTEDDECVNYDYCLIVPHGC
jgi:hypothetical protein